MIDREALVRRHDPVNTGFDPYGLLTAGNGEFAFSCDITGLQTFPEPYESGIPLCTMAQWGWHSIPLPASLTDKSFRMTPMDTGGRPVGYPTEAEGQEELYRWLRENPHRFSLGRVGFRLMRRDGLRGCPEDIRDAQQRLDLWEGRILSRFTFDGETVEVETAVHPESDILDIRIRSGLLLRGQLAVELEFPYGSPDRSGGCTGQEDAHRTVQMAAPGDDLLIARRMDDTRYFVRLRGGNTRMSRHGHLCELSQITESEIWQLGLHFSPDMPEAPMPPATETERRRRDWWHGFWKRGAALEAHSPDGRGQELERRVVLSQYQTAVHCAGSMPPQETGLMMNSWYGRSHLEMHFWHAAHFPLWGRGDLLIRSMDWYLKILPEACALAASQGYPGCRWPKMVDQRGKDCPSPIAGLLIWQQPHPLLLLELCYQVAPYQALLRQYEVLVRETADFMAAFASEGPDGYWHLGPPLIPAQENHAPGDTRDPVYELEYWHLGLGIAIQWMERMGAEPNPLWERVRSALAPLPEDAAGGYAAHAWCRDTYTEKNTDHPSMLAALGVLPGHRVNRSRMQDTLERVRFSWQWQEAWGWDFPMAAMTAARLGDACLAADFLLMEAPKNICMKNGHNRQADRQDLPVYLPGNGALLLAVALMAAGTDRSAPCGFPPDWVWQAEGFMRYPEPEAEIRS